MAYSLESLKQILEQVLSSDHDHLWILDNKPPIGSLLENVSLLKDLLEKSPTPSNTRTIESQLRDAVYRLEDIVESLISNQILPANEGQGSVCDRFAFSYEDLDEAICEFDCVKEEMLKIVAEAESNQALNLEQSSSFSTDSPSPEPILKKVVIGFDEDILRLKEQLVGRALKLQIIPIVGMGGIGKTTLAEALYYDSYVTYYFDIRAWATVSQDYNQKSVLLSLLGCKKKLNDDMRAKSEYQLAEELYKSLKGRRYLIVMDDLWETNVWDDLKRYFPNDNNGSRIVLTTRELNVAKYADSSSPHHQMRLLNEDQSWNLLHEKVFSQQQCPRELEIVGRKIAKNCVGLPLSISVIGGLLSAANRSHEFWELVARNTMTFLENSDEQVSKILSLSYNHLPHHLKPCFLYFGAFPEDDEISASKLVKLLVAEGFMKRVAGKSLEEAAEVHLNALVFRNLIFVREQEPNFKVKAYGIHDLLRDLCLRKALEEKFLYVKNLHDHNKPQDTVIVRRLSPHRSSRDEDNIYDSIESILFSRSLIRTDMTSPFHRSFWNMRLLRVLDTYYSSFKTFPAEILELVNLRYLALSCFSDLPRSISRLWNLQTLIFYKIFNNTTFIVPSEILQMKHLRHIKLENFCLVCSDKFLETFPLHENLQSLSTVTLFKKAITVLEKFPNLKKMRIFCHALDLSVKDLSPLCKLETLRCTSDTPVAEGSFLSYLTFPDSLRKLTLRSCAVPLEVMRTIGSLPNLEILKLQDCNFQSSDDSEEGECEWEPVESEFCKLQLLLLVKTNLVKLVADETSFPSLRHLVIRSCTSLEEIPISIGDIAGLEMIEVDECSPSLVESAKQIQEEQADNGNTVLQLRVVKSAGSSSKVPKHFFRVLEPKRPWE